MEESRRLNREVVAEFRANGGKLGGPYADVDVLLLTTTSADTGEQRVLPLGYGRDGERLIVFAADDGRENGPNWYHDLLAHPRAEVEVGSERWAVTASVATGEERNMLWDKQFERWAFMADLQAKVAWEIPVVILTAVTPLR
ncbi:deazaflavin-dependent oxidoreductase (nitroreductase family) [Nocardia mexicana]|uniref:Deazaflavin-dependent oxidoreductase (Nitroreductase family) n=2 Tax=Nocardia mexicana TaxID=279262 RepID=A0A370GLJ5_9NOCA|nr:deazaflavin-dependent oxidoreductase (nitroreductase family) [Nocardia mexicana]